ncbi:nickel/cobalt transporter [Agrobacterium rubi]|uniref:Nickel/cobalt efflux system n=1 Tax=Agrobacterium rubi TaxID=28099 RepID=A0AAE7R0B3_9HYPH|nr:nickel/cobalt transporter [Agrobacterium rubi]NTE89207.1 nickel/cobalt transporter [Agrobacterium rubi]NTF04989.1 nickel/cobalt transporter [Agrobacterium rubi]NTF38759.1 nickel/cobalt transporter [Agrobacterium rubi]OCJ43199.1 delayed-early response protein/equilibrative nucleoside transporter [Agrobacterium rubi]QTF99914.1 nickel/cobalt transporter [Agrobacterium rubi]
MLNRRDGFLIAVGLLAVTVTMAHAQSPLGIGSAEPSISVGGPLGPFFQWINVHQQSFYRALTGALKAMREDPWALTSLIGLSFAYGVFHAAGPGHGKAVISSYMIANEIQLKRGILISFISALLQGAVAIALVGAAYLVLRGTSITMTKATQAMEIASFAMVALFGAWLLFRKLRSFMTQREPTPTLAVEPAGPASAMAFNTSRFSSIEEETGSVRTGPVRTGMGTGLRFQGRQVFADHAPSGNGEVCTTCGNAHAPDPSLLQSRDFSLQEAWSAIIAVGLRPCSGAIIVMSFSILNGLLLGGVLSVLAMSLGTAITVTLLASLAVKAKDIAVRYAGSDSTRAMRLANGIEIAGALVVLLMGLALLGASLQA